MAPVTHVTLGAATKFPHNPRRCFYPFLSEGQLKVQKGKGTCPPSAWAAAEAHTEGLGPPSRSCPLCGEIHPKLKDQFQEMARKYLRERDDTVKAWRQKHHSASALFEN